MGARPIHSYLRQYQPAGDLGEYIEPTPSNKDLLGTKRIYSDSEKVAHGVCISY
jgi:hypothetical protein